MNPLSQLVLSLPITVHLFSIRRRLHLLPASHLTSAVLLLFHPSVPPFILSLSLKSCRRDFTSIPPSSAITVTFTSCSVLTSSCAVQLQPSPPAVPSSSGRRVPASSLAPQILGLAMASAGQFYYQYLDNRR
ncbi:hypothetical protein HN51_045695 [Arachis hypogaea]|uniref:uncharacterized protein LOC107614464 isoform X1 n=1 Tax=Arachis ipaensis TaxID=130454 RepID=UPI0007AFD016|nr:uncharacterized protein LOC107614464 isoform X1 [Arachis ipaensis]XP_025671868.1 uncharacterized protein LOC112771360 isoform X1 [Arachis hypogaea]